MPSRRRALVSGLAVAVLLLFAGRWTAAFLADRWWGATFSPAARDFLSGWHLFRLAIDAVAVTIASTWFIAHLLIVTRAVRSVQIPGHVGDLEFRETVRPRTLVGAAAVLGLVLGLVVGLDASSHWATIALAWHGVSIGIVEPVLGRDAGVYVAQLPLWRLLHEQALLLVGLGLLLAVMLYAIVGAIRIERRRPAINDHARAHIGWLLVALALVLCWGYYLEPLELVAGLREAPTAGAVRRVSVTAPALIGTALMAAALSAVWALRGRHALAAAGWTILALASVGGHYVAPVVMRGTADPSAPDSTRLALEREAFGLAPERDAGLPSLLPAPLFDEAAVRRLFPTSSAVRAVDAATLDVAGTRRPAWLALVVPPNGPATIVGVAADRAATGGAALFFRAGDTLAYPSPYPLATLGVASPRPGAARYVLGEGRGVGLESPARRMALAWALQAGELLAPDAGLRVDWSLDPRERVARLAPFAAWSPARARLIGSRLLWVLDGYHWSRTFPLVPRAAWAGGDASAVRAAFIAIVEAASGDTRIYLRENGGKVAEAWADMSGGLVLPSAALPAEVDAAAGYPQELFGIQARLVAARERATVAPTGGAAVSNAVQPAWDSAGTLYLVAAIASDASERLSSALVASGAPARVLHAVDSNRLLAPKALERSWGRFATLGPIQDSVTAAGARLEASPVRYFRSSAGLSALQVHTAARDNARPAIVWVSVANGRRLGAGRTFAEAWSNLEGTAISPPVGGGGPIADARRWMRLADEALKRGDWAGFGRAFEALREVLQAGGE